MGRIEKVDQLTGSRYLSMYNIKATSVHGTPVNYFMASRNQNTADLKLNTGENRPDGVAVYSLYGSAHDRVVLIRQYRYTIGTYIYEFPAGLVEPGETWMEAARREIREETGLVLEPLPASDLFSRPYFTTIGMTDESCATVYGYASGEVSTLGEEASEEIEVVLADRKEVRRILNEENVAIMCAYHLMHFLADPDPFAFLFSSERICRDKGGTR